MNELNFEEGWEKFKILPRKEELSDTQKSEYKKLLKFIPDRNWIMLIDYYLKNIGGWFPTPKDILACYNTGNWNTVKYKNKSFNAELDCKDCNDIGFIIMYEPDNPFYTYTFRCLCGQKTNPKIKTVHEGLNDGFIIKRQCVFCGINKNVGFQIISKKDRKIAVCNQCVSRYGSNLEKKVEELNKGFMVKR